MVEMSPIGFALVMAREELWDRLGVEEKGRVAEWVGGG